MGRSFLGPSKMSYNVYYVKLERGEMGITRSLLWPETVSD